MNILYNNLTQNDSKIIQDNKIKIPLKEHQKTAINAMIKFESDGLVTYSKKAYIKNYHIWDKLEYPRYHRYDTFEKNSKDIKIEIESNYGILSDKVGSGKTFEIMGLIVYGDLPKERPHILNSSIYSVLKYTDNIKAIKTNLIIVPHNIVSQWKDTFKYSTLKTFTISKHTDIDFLEFEENIFLTDPVASDADYNEFNCVGYYDCIIVSSTMFSIYYNKFKNIKYSRIIIDEIVSIKLPSELELNSNFLWFITATPSGIKHVRRFYIKALVSTMTENIINNIIVKNNDEYIDESMTLPQIKQIIIKCLTPAIYGFVRNYVDGEILNMLNAGNIQEAITKLNCNIETSEGIVEVVTKKIKKELYNKKQELEYEQKRIPDDTKLHEEKLKKIELKISELESKYIDLEKRVNAFEKNDCPICFELFEYPMITPCCNNIFCIKCLSSCVKCPMCREPINIVKCTIIDNKIEKKEKEKLGQLCSKIDNLITIIKSNQNGKFIIFSNYDKTFDNIYKKLNENNISNNRLIGSNSVINNIIKRFDEGEIKVLMLNASNYGSGINLQMATDIILYHELDVELETQVIGRAQRLGRTNSLNVYYLLNDNEKVNCSSPTLNLDIFDDNKQMLEEFIKSNIDINEEINTQTDSDSLEIETTKTKTKNKKTKKTK